MAKVYISGLPGAPTAVAIRRATWDCLGVTVKIGFDHTTDDFVLVCSGQGNMDFSEHPIKDPASAGGNGDIVFTTIGHGAGDAYTIFLELDVG